MGHIISYLPPSTGPSLVQRRLGLVLGATERLLEGRDVLRRVPSHRPCRRHTAKTREARERQTESMVTSVKLNICGAGGVES